MKREEICRAISEKLEPLDSLPSVENEIVDIGDWRRSPKGFWLAVSLYEEGDVPRWLEDDYFRSEDASARLLEAMPEPPKPKEIPDALHQDCNEQVRGTER